MDPTPGHSGQLGDLELPPSPPLEAVVSSVLGDPLTRNAGDIQFSAEDMDVDPDPPGPSSTYIPPPPSPPLPSFTKVKYPGHDQDSDDSEDEILTKLPIYVTSSLSPHLNLFQYPLHHRTLAPPTWARDRGKFITARVKEKFEGRVEIEIPVDEGQDVWRGEEAREMKFVMDVNDGEDLEGGTWGRMDYRENGNGNGNENVNGTGRKDKKKARIVEKAPEKWGDKMRLRSEVVPKASHYYSGVIHDGALHLHPVNKILQFRTSLQYVDEMKTDPDAAQAIASRMDAIKPPPNLKSGDRAPAEIETDGSGTIQDLRQKLWRTEGRELAQPWVPYAWNDGEDPAVAEKLEALFLPEEKRYPLKCTTRGLDYIPKI